MKPLMLLGRSAIKFDRKGQCRRTVSKLLAKCGIDTPIMYLHSASTYDLKMNNIFNFCGEDLFNIISSMDPVIVDSCAEWKQRSLSEPHKAFILGRTIDHEAHNLEGLYFNKKIKGGRRNVFLFAMANFGGHLVIEIDRLDPHFKAIFRGALPTLDELSTEDRLKWNDPSKRSQLRDRILQIATSTLPDVLLQRIKSTAPVAYKDFVVSCNVAEWAYALLFQETGHRDRTELDKFLDNDENLFGDTQLIQEALLLGAKILSTNTKHVWRMASYCGIKCER